MLLGLLKSAGPHFRVALKFALNVPFIFGDTNADAPGGGATFPIFPAAPKIGLTKEKSFIAEFLNLNIRKIKMFQAEEFKYWK